MKIAAAHAIAEIISPEELHADYIVPSVFDKRVGEAVAARPVVVAGRRFERRRAFGRRRHAVDGHLRRQPVQSLRLDRGGVGGDRDA